MSDCIFCKIINGEIPSSKVYENEHVFAFKDINPCAPVHILIVPKVHIESADSVDEGNSEAVRQVFLAIPAIAAAAGLANGYRVVTNVGEDGGQTVRHLHFHLLGGRKFSEKIVCPVIRAGGKCVHFALLVTRLFAVDGLFYGIAFRQNKRCILALYNSVQTVF